MKTWHFYEPVFRRWVVFMIGSYKEFRQELEDCKYKEMEYIKDAKGMCIELNEETNDSGQNCTMVWLKKFEEATLVHELSHLVMFCLDQVGVPISRNNTETYAFYIEYWHTTILRTRKRLPNGRKYSEVKYP